MTKKIIITVLSILLFAGVVVGGYFEYKKLSEKNPPDAGTLGTEQKGDYKDFTVTDVNGKEVKLSDFIGKPIVINFWASWCGPCRSELPAFDKVAKRKRRASAFSDGKSFVWRNRNQGQGICAERKLFFPVVFRQYGNSGEHI